MGAPRKKDNQVVKSFNMYQKDFDELKRLKDRSELPWVSFFKLLIAEHKDMNK